MEDRNCTPLRPPAPSAALTPQSPLPRMAVLEDTVRLSVSNIVFGGSFWGLKLTELPGWGCGALIVGPQDPPPAGSCPLKLELLRSTPNGVTGESKNDPVQVDLGRTSKFVCRFNDWLVGGNRNEDPTFTLELELSSAIDIPSQVVRDSSWAGVQVSLVQATCQIKDTREMGRLCAAVLDHNCVNSCILAVGLPWWAQYIPPRIYSFQIRQAIEMLEAVSAFLTLVWSIWTLYENSDYVKAVIAPVVDIVWAYERKVIESLNWIVELWQAYFILYFAPIFQVTTRLFTLVSTLAAPMAKRIRRVMLKVPLHRLNAIIYRVTTPLRVLWTVVLRMWAVITTVRNRAILIGRRVFSSRMIKTIVGVATAGFAGAGRAYTAVANSQFVSIVSSLLGWISLLVKMTFQRFAGSRAIKAATATVGKAQATVSWLANILPRPQKISQTITETEHIANRVKVEAAKTVSTFQTVVGSPPFRAGIHNIKAPFSEENESRQRRRRSGDSGTTEM